MPSGRPAIAVFGPDREAARLETSKAFCHEVATAAGVRTARARAFRGGQAAEAQAFVLELEAGGALAVLKADGLAGGKGVIVTESAEQAIELVPSFLAGRPADAPALVIEERLEGMRRVSSRSATGRGRSPCPAARDHKRLCDGDTGPNTGGMGAYSPLPDLDADAVERVLETVHRPILAAMAAPRSPFRGFLYAGLMLTADGPVLLECNVRLGDPEAQVILPRIAGSLGPWLLAAANGRLPADAPARLPELPDAAVGIVLAAKGYPGDPRRGDPIAGLEAAEHEARSCSTPGPSGGRRAATARTAAGCSRSSGAGATSPPPARRPSAAADAITWDGLQRRHDIAADLPQPAEAVA